MDQSKWPQKTLAVMVMALVTVLVLMAPVSASTSRTATATPGNDGRHPWASDGCTAIPDVTPLYDFHHACVHHDGCYQGHWLSQSGCDKKFRQDMVASCRWLFPGTGSGNRILRELCETQASLIYRAVTIVGPYYYNRHGNPGLGGST